MSSFKEIPTNDDLLKGSNMIVCVLLVSNSRCCFAAPGDHEGAVFRYPFVNREHDDVIKGNIFRVTGHLCGEFTGDRWISRIKASDTELWCFLWSAPWIIGWVNAREAGNLRLHRGHYDVIVMRTLYAFSRDWSFKIAWSLHWRHNEEDSGSNHWGLEYLLNRLFRRRARKTSKLRVTGGLPSQRASNADMFPFDDVVMLWNMISPVTYAR